MPLTGEEKGARTPLVCSCLCPEGQSVLALLGDAGRSVCFLGRNATCYTHTIVHNVLFPQAGSECNAVSLLSIQACPPESAVPEGQPPAPGTVARLGLGSPSCSPICSGLLGELCPWGSCWSPAHMQTFLSLHQSAYILASGFWCLFLCNAEIFNLFSYFI